MHKHTSSPSCALGRNRDYQLADYAKALRITARRAAALHGNCRMTRPHEKRAALDDLGGLQSRMLCHLERP